MSIGTSKTRREDLAGDSFAALWVTDGDRRAQNSAVYVGVIIGGALVGERAVNYGFDRAWERANAGKLWRDVRARMELE